MNRDESAVQSVFSLWCGAPEVRTIAARVEAHRHEYGGLDIDSDNRNYLKEAGEELADAVWYLAAEVVRRRRRGLCTSFIEIAGRIASAMWARVQTQAQGGC